MKQGYAREDKILSCQEPAKQVELWCVCMEGVGRGSRGENWGTKEAESISEKDWDTEKERERGGGIDQTGFPILLLKIHPSSLCLIGNTWFWSWEDCAGTITPYLQAPPGEVAFGRFVPPGEGDAWLSLDLAPCLKTRGEVEGEGEDGGGSWGGGTASVSLWKLQDKPVSSGEKKKLPSLSWMPAQGLNNSTSKCGDSEVWKDFVSLVGAQMRQCVTFSK